MDRGRSVRLTDRVAPLITTKTFYRERTQLHRRGWPSNFKKKTKHPRRAAFSFGRFVNESRSIRLLDVHSLFTRLCIILRVCMRSFTVTVTRKLIDGFLVSGKLDYRRSVDVDERCPSCTYVNIRVYSFVSISWWKEVGSRSGRNRDVKLRRSECAVWSWRDGGPRRIASGIPEDGENRFASEVATQPIGELDSLKLISYLEQLAILELRCWIFEGEQGDSPGLVCSITHSPRMKGMLLLMSTMVWFVAAEVFLGDVDEPSK